MSSSLPSSAAETAGTWLGYARAKLTPNWFKALNKYTEPGGSAEEELGKIICVTIKSRDEGPVHKSHYNPEDEEYVISVQVKGEKRTRTCHVYVDGTGTTKMHGDRK